MSQEPLEIGDMSIGDTPPPTLLTIPSELVAHIAHHLKGTHVIALSKCHRSLRHLATSLDIWREKLQSELGFTEAGIELWLRSSGRKLFEAYDFVSRKHEPLECSVLGEPVVDRWPGCIDVKLCVELANPWPQNVWTLFRVCSPLSDVVEGRTDPWADLASSSSGRRMHTLPLWPESSRRIQCVGYAAPGGKDAVIVSIAAAPREDLADVAKRNWSRSPHAVPTAAIGWMVGGEALSEAVPTVQAMLLPACKPKGNNGEAGGVPALVVLGEHTLRVDKASLTPRGELCLEVMTAIDLCAHGLTLPLEEAAPYELCCDAGAEVPTTADRSDRKRGSHNRNLCGRDFEWRPSDRSERLAQEERHETTRHAVLTPALETYANVCSLPGGMSVVQGGWEVADEATPAPAGEALCDMTFTPLSRSLVFVPLELWHKDVAEACGLAG